MNFVSYSTGGHSNVHGHGELIAIRGDRATVRCAETRALINVHKSHVNAEPTPAEIAAQCAAFRETWLPVRLARDELADSCVESPLIERQNFGAGRYL